MSTTDEALILLHPRDNVLVTTRSLAAGTELRVEGEPVQLEHDLAVGHKLARSPLGRGEKVFKYGAPIGSMLGAVARGEWVHMHNMTSDYLASHTRERPDRPAGVSEESRS